MHANYQFLQILHIDSNRKTIDTTRKKTLKFTKVGNLIFIFRLDVKI